MDDKRVEWNGGKEQKAIDVLSRTGHIRFARVAELTKAHAKRKVGVMDSRGNEGYLLSESSDQGSRNIFVQLNLHPAAPVEIRGFYRVGFSSG